MQHLCPTCRRQFGEPGFCPFDGDPGRRARCASSPIRRVRDEPEFTADDRPPSCQHVFSEDIAPTRERRWPVVLLLALIGGAALAFALIVPRWVWQRRGRFDDCEPSPLIPLAP